MSQFQPALDYLLDNEDPTRSYKETVDNNGGRVLAGINSKSFPADEARIATLPLPMRAAAVARFYDDNFWTPMQLGFIDSQGIATRVLDEEVNTGKGEAVLLLQRAINTIRANAVEADGKMGPKTLSVVNAVDPQALLAAYRQQRLSYYDEVVAKHPGDEKYLADWLARALK